MTSTPRAPKPKAKAKRWGEEDIMTDAKKPLYTIKGREDPFLPWAILDEGAEIALTYTKDDAEMIAEALNDTPFALATQTILDGARMDAVLGEKEKRYDLVREAVERELKRRGAPPPEAEGRGRWKFLK
jgi:hypothetical protein